MRRCCCLFICLGLIGLSACSKEEPQFSQNDKLAALVPEAQAAVASQLTDLFGTAIRPHAPHWLSIDRGGLPAEVDAVEIADSGLVTLILAVNDSQLDIKPKQTVEILLTTTELLETAETAQTTLQSFLLDVVQYDPQTHQLTLSGSLLREITPGMKVVCNVNSRLISGQYLYRQHCQVCHGLTGDSSGPQSQILNPQPRDFRYGIFKYTSTQPGLKPCTADLERTIKQGIAGTGMTAFKLLGNHEVKMIAEYVKYLSQRGETELQLCVETEIDFGQEVLHDELVDAQDDAERKKIQQNFQSDLHKFLQRDLAAISLDVTEMLNRSWEQAEQENAIVKPVSQLPEPDAASGSQPELTSIANGKRLYLNNDLQCAACHGKTGKGDGEQTLAIQKKRDGSDYDRPGLHDDWGQPIKPRDFSYGVFHGGRQPEDLYRRIFAGVKGTPMPAYGSKGMSESDIWDLVNYLYFLAGDYPNLSVDDAPVADSLE